MSKIDEYLEKVDEVIKNGKFKDNWESLSQFKTPSFLRQKDSASLFTGACIPFPRSATNGIRAECT